MYDEYDENWEREFIKKNKENAIKEKIGRTILDVRSEFSFHWKVTENDLDPALWSPFSDWREKIRSLGEIDELNSFRKQLTDAIEKKEKEKQNELNKKQVVEIIEKKLDRNKINISEEESEEVRQKFKREIYQLKEGEIWKISSIEKSAESAIDKLIEIKKNNIDEKMRDDENHEIAKKGYRKTESVISEHSTNVQEYLEQKYPTKETREKIKKINISNELLEGSLDLREFINLEELNCEKNKISSLNVSSCLNLKKLSCNSNELVNLDLRDLNNLRSIVCSKNLLTNIIYPLSPKELSVLNVNNNNISEQSIEVFSKFTSLKELRIGSNNKARNHNRFYGSLKFIGDLTSLEELDISNTNVNGDLEYLPSKLKKIYCDEGRNAGCQRIVKQLRKYLDYSLFWLWGEKWYNFSDWREDNIHLIEKIYSLEKELKNSKNNKKEEFESVIVQEDFSFKSSK